MRASQEQLAQDARFALDCIEAVTNAISHFAIDESERRFLALQLLRASCDHGRSLCFILANNPIDLAGSALVLHRSQIESFLRAIFIGILATEEQLQDFIANDLGPRTSATPGKWQKIGVPALATMVEAYLEEANPNSEASKLETMVGNAWNPLSGMVHGGRALHALYRDDRRQIGCWVPPEVHVQTTVNAVAITNFCLVGAASMAGLGPEEENAALEAPRRAFQTYVACRNNLLPQMGLIEHITPHLSPTNDGVTQA